MSLVAILSGAAAAGAPSAQYARPITDVAAGNWTASTGTDLYAVLDEDVAEDSDYIYNTTGTADAVFALTALSTPVAGTVTVRVRARAGS